VAKGYEAVAAYETARVRVINGMNPIDVVLNDVWTIVQPLLPRTGRR